MIWQLAPGLFLATLEAASFCIGSATSGLLFGSVCVAVVELGVVLCWWDAELIVAWMLRGVPLCGHRERVSVRVLLCERKCWREVFGSGDGGGGME